LAEIEITKKQSANYQKLAEVEENVILDAITIAHTGHAAVTAVGVRRSKACRDRIGPLSRRRRLAQVLQRHLGMLIAELA